MRSEKGKLRAIVVGGSIAGVSCAHALSSAGWDVLVLEKASGPTTGSSPTGAGLGLDTLACNIISSWLGDSGPLQDATMPLTIEQNLATDTEKKINCTLTRDEQFNFRAAHWADLHGLLLGSLQPEIMLWGHQFLSFCVADDKGPVTVKAKVIQTGETVELVGDLLVAADGSLSSIRQTFIPNHKLRYAGYCAWRGVLDFSGKEDSEIIRGLRRVYPDLGNCLYFDLSEQTHCVLYELLDKRMNWLWYFTQPEPEGKSNSVTMKVSEEMIKKMKEDAEKYWVPELAALMKATDEPFLNVIYDSDPLDRIAWDNVVLIGDAAHPTTPHCTRSTNMSVLDAAVLGKCLQKCDPNGLKSGLAEYQSARLPVVSKQVLHARRLGRIKQGLSVPNREPFNPRSASSEDCCEIEQKNVPFFSGIPDKKRDEMKNSERKELQKPKAVVVGASISGVSCAHALLKAGWDVVVLDKSSGPRIASPTGAGLSLDPLSCKIIESWLGDSEPLSKATMPLTIDQSQMTDAEKISWLLTRDENLNIRSAHWSDLHFMLRSALPSEIFLWGHLFQSFSIAEDKASVCAKAQVLQTGDIIEITGDLLVAADGSVSSVRRAFLPDLKLRYSGYCCWRGVQNYSGNEDSDTIKDILKAYPDLGNCLYYDLSRDSHCVTYEVPGKRINWVWCVNQPEPDFKGDTVTMKADTEAIELMHLEAEKVWGTELARLIRETKEPFINALYDCDPLETIFWDNVVLVGDAAHPTTPHSARSTNAAILDAAVLGKCLEKHGGLRNLQDALSEYQSVRLPVMAKQVLHARNVGKIRQGLALTVSEPFDPKNVSKEVCCLMQQRSTPFFYHIPEILDLKQL